MPKIISSTLKNLGAVASGVSLSFFVSATTYAQRAPTPGTPTTGTTTGGVREGLDSIKSIFPNIFGRTEWTLLGVFEVILKLGLFFAFLVSIIFIVIGGYQYITSAGNQTQSESGKKTLQNALIGLVIVFLAYVMVDVLYRFLTEQVV